MLLVEMMSRLEKAEKLLDAAQQGLIMGADFAVLERMVPTNVSRALYATAEEIGVFLGRPTLKPETDEKQAPDGPCEPNPPPT